MQSMDYYEKETDTKITLKQDRITMIGNGAKPFQDKETKDFVLNPRVTVRKLDKPKKIYRDTKNKTFLDKKDEE